MRPKDELSRLFSIKKGDVIQSQSRSINGICNIKSIVFFIKGSQFFIKRLAKTYPNELCYKSGCIFYFIYS